MSSRNYEASASLKHLKALLLMTMMPLAQGERANQSKDEKIRVVTTATIDPCFRV